MIDIYCKDLTCPICESELDGIDNSDENVQFCTNGCYKIEKNSFRDINLKIHYQYSTYVFGERVARFRTNSESLEKLENVVVQHILDWKHNDRYLMKILARG